MTNLRPVSSFHFLTILISVLLVSPLIAFAQSEGYWQQEVHYTMDIDFDVETHRFNGQQSIVYTNNSPDTLSRVFYHLYFNAFQPGSMMAVRSQNIQDTDSRMANRFSSLNENEIGYQKVRSLTQDGAEVEFMEDGTILEVRLAHALPPGSSTNLEMEFEAQVPVQIRRSGRDNEEGIDYSMAQWYPKISAYDKNGWHPNPYIAREFYGVFGEFDVTIHIDRDYVLAATAYLQNPEEIGYGYEAEGVEVQRPEGDKLSWHFVSDYQHDFMWAADPDYHHTKVQVPDGPLLRFFYQTDPVAENAGADSQAQLLENWEALPGYTVQAFEYMNEHFGRYPYGEYSVMQGGDGGMEYIMGTLITGNRSLESLVGVTVHELVHSWYHGVLASNESLYHWMDEGFTTYASTLIMAGLFEGNTEDSFENAYSNYFRITELGLEEPMQTHADHFDLNTAYSIAAYYKGMIFLNQLNYIIGREAFDRGMKRYYDEWQFRHPTGLDFLSIMEKESGLVLDWYYDYWVNTTHTINYAVESVEGTNGMANIFLRRNGRMPMPLDIEVEYVDGTIEHYYIPLRIMRGEKENEYPETDRIVAEDWPWVNTDYTLTVGRPADEITRVEIDPSRRMADINSQSNIWLAGEARNEPEQVTAPEEQDN